MLAVALLDRRAASLMLSVPTILLSLSLGLFLAGVLGAARQRWWLLLSSLLQTLLTAAAAILQSRWCALVVGATVKAVAALLFLVDDERGLGRSGRSRKVGEERLTEREGDVRV